MDRITDLAEAKMLAKSKKRNCVAMYLEQGEYGRKAGGVGDTTEARRTKGGAAEDDNGVRWTKERLRLRGYGEV